MRSRCDGYVLVAVLATMLVLASLVASASLVAQSALRSARADATAAVLDGLLRSGLELAAYQVFTLRQPFAAVNDLPIRLPGGTAVPVFSDEGAQIDINASDPVLLGRAFAAAGIDPDKAALLVERLVAMRGSGADRATPIAAPEDEASVAAPTGGTQAPHTDFPTVGDFIAFAKLDGDVRARLLPLLTVDNPDGLVDVMTASRQVLLALPGMSDAEVEAIVSDRRGGAAAVPGLKAVLADQASYVKFEPNSCFGLLVTATDALGRTARRHGVVAASRSAGEPFYLLAWERAP